MLPCKIETTDFVINEITNEDQKKSIMRFIENGKLHVVSFASEEFQKVTLLFNNATNNISLTDCSVWYHAKKTKGRLLTGDAKLRRVAFKDNVMVSGILYVFDNLVEHGIVEIDLCAMKLAKLLLKNSRLPRKDCEARIKRWKNI